MNLPPRRRAWRDVLCSLGLCAAYTLAQAAPASGGDALALAALSVGTFAVFEIRAGGRALAAVGIRRDNLTSSFQLSTITLLPLVAGCLWYATLHGIFRPAHFLVAVLLYPVWGFFQQVIFQGIILTALRDLGLGRWSIVLTSLMFVAIHYPSDFLMKATAVGGPLFSLTYFLRPNVFPLALYHGVLGAALYYIFRQKDVLGGLFS